MRKTFNPKQAAQECGARMMVHAYLNRGAFDGRYIDRASGVVYFGGAQ